VTVSRTVVPGEWYGVLGDDVIVLLPPDAKARVAGLWETVDEGAGFDEVLDAVISGGLRGLPAFVLVSADAADVKVVIRGAGEATLTTADGEVTIEGSEDTTWVERNVTGVTSLRVRVGEGEGPSYAVGSGLVRVASVQHPAAPAASGPERVAEPAAGAAPLLADAEVSAVPLEPPAPSPARVLPPDPQLEAEREAEREREAQEEARRHAEQHPPEPPAPVVETPPVAPFPGAPVPVPDALGLPGFDPLTSPDLAVPRSHGPGAPSAPAGPGPGNTGQGDPDDTGEMRDAGDTGDAGEAETGVLAPQPPEPQQPSGPRAVARLVFSSGEVVDVDRAIVVGRAPEHGRFAGDDQTRLVTVPSPHQEISSTHLEIRPGTGADHGSAVVTDLGSTNGTVVAQPGLPAEDLRPGIAVQLVPGSTVDLGEGVTIQVTQV
jgi:FHA domain